MQTTIYNSFLQHPCIPTKFESENVPAFPQARPPDTWHTFHTILMDRIQLPGRMPYLESNRGSSSPFWLSLLTELEPHTCFAGRFHSYADLKLEGRRCCPPQRAFNYMSFKKSNFPPRIYISSKNIHIFHNKFAFLEKTHFPSKQCNGNDN